MQEGEQDLEEEDDSEEEAEDDDEEELEGSDEDDGLEEGATDGPVVNSQPGEAVATPGFGHSAAEEAPT